jgi:hypothetical protein
LVKVFDKFQTQVKANIYEIECNTRSVINTLETKGDPKDPTINDPKFFEETNNSLVEANRVLDHL